MSIVHQNKQAEYDRKIARLVALLPEGAELEDIMVEQFVKIVKKTIGGVGIGGCDFNFVPALNAVEQVFNLGLGIPPRARIMDICLVVDATFTGAITLAAEVGSTSSGAEYIASGDILTLNNVLAMTVGSAFVTAPVTTGLSVFVSITPGANWNLVTAGKVSVYVTYTDVSSL